MSDLSKSTFLVFDHHGLFLPLALRLGETGAKVWYQTPQDRRDLLNDSCIGDGMAERNVYCTDDFWLHKSEIDTFCFPDIRHCGEQLELRSQGKAVWGAGYGMDLELNRVYFMDKLKELGLDVPPFTVVEGFSNLLAYLKDKQDIFIKLSKWRGSWETMRWRSEAQDLHTLYAKVIKLWFIREHLKFVCFPKIETDLEIGADTYNVDGRWPAKMLHGIEQKDEAYFGAVTDTVDMPEQVLPIMDAFSPYLKEVGYRNQWSMEVRVTKTENFFIDATTRGGLPSTASFLKAKNIAEIIYHGARGEFVEIDYGFKFCAEAMVKVSGQPGACETVLLDPEVRAELMLSDCCEVDGQIWFPADEDGTISDIGWLRATGDTPTEVAERMNQLADDLPDGCDASVESLADVIREIESEHESGIKFTDAEMPSPEVVLEPS